MRNKDFDEEEDFSEDDFDEDKPKKVEEDKDEFEEDTFEKKKETRGRKPRSEPPAEFTEKKSPRTPREKSTRYAAYSFPERAGIKDNSMNESIGENIFILLAKILNDLEDIKLAVGA